MTLLQAMLQVTALLLMLPSLHRDVLSILAWESFDMMSLIGVSSKVQVSY
jgi:hypothetical protein